MTGGVREGKRRLLLGAWKLTWVCTQRTGLRHLRQLPLVFQCPIEPGLSGPIKLASYDGISVILVGVCSAGPQAVRSRKDPRFLVTHRRTSLPARRLIIDPALFRT